MVFLLRLFSSTSYRALVVVSLWFLLAACSGTGPKLSGEGQSSVPESKIEPKSYSVMPLHLANDIELALLPDEGASELQVDVDTKLVKLDSANAEAMFIWQVPNQTLSRFDGVRARIFIDQILNKLQVRLRQDAGFAYSFDVEVRHWPQSEASKLLVIRLGSQASALPELQAIVLDELYIQRPVAAVDGQFVNAWLAVFLDRKVGYRARLQHLPSI